LAVSGSQASNASVAALGLTRTVLRLRALGKHVAILGPVPEIGYDVPTAAQVVYWSGRNLESIIAPTRDAFLERNRLVLALLDTLRRTTGVEVVMLDSQTCDSSICHVLLRGRLLYRDDDHLSTFGSMQLAPLFANVLRQGATAQ
jgi:hypothetical protein